MKIGFDVDGVLADFNTSFIALVKQVTGEDKFGEGYWPTCWDYPQSVGYTNEQVKAVWQEIFKQKTFWKGLPPLQGAEDLRRAEIVNDPAHECYFITTRAGKHVKHQTEGWLDLHLMTNWPTVLISKHKGSAAATLELDCYIDDKLENVQGVIDISPSTRAYLLDSPWNQHSRTSKMRVVGSVQEFLTKEGLNAG